MHMFTRLNHFYVGVILFSPYSFYLILLVNAVVAFRCGTIISGDSSGNVQFWDGQFGTLLQAHLYHKGDVNALVAAPNHNRVFSAGSDGQVS